MVWWLTPRNLGGTCQSAHSTSPRAAARQHITPLQDVRCLPASQRGPSLLHTTEAEGVLQGTLHPSSCHPGERDEQALSYSLTSVLPGNMGWSSGYITDLRKCGTVPNTVTNQTLDVSKWYPQAVKISDVVFCTLVHPYPGNARMYFPYQEILSPKCKRPLQK